MARRITIQRYPLLKVTLPLALIVAGIGIYLFVTHQSTCTAEGATSGNCTAGSQYNDYDPMILLLWVGPAALVLLASAFVKRKDEMTLLYPTDQLKSSSRADLQKVLEGLEEARKKGEIPEDRYVNARNRVLSEMKGK